MENTAKAEFYIFSSEKENWIICPFDLTCAVQSSCCCCVPVRDITV